MKKVVTNELLLFLLLSQPSLPNTCGVDSASLQSRPPSPEADDKLNNEYSVQLVLLPSVGVVSSRFLSDKGNKPSVTLSSSSLERSSSLSGEKTFEIQQCRSVAVRVRRRWRERVNPTAIATTTTACRHLRHRTESCR